MDKDKYLLSEDKLSQMAERSGKISLIGKPPLERTVSGGELSNFLKNLSSIPEQSIQTYGLMIEGLFIDGDVELEHAKIPYSVFFSGCEFRGKFETKFCSFKGLYFWPDTSVETIIVVQNTFHDNLVFSKLRSLQKLIVTESEIRKNLLLGQLSIFESEQSYIEFSDLEVRGRFDILECFFENTGFISRRNKIYRSCRFAASQLGSLDNVGIDLSQSEFLSDFYISDSTRINGPLILRNTQFNRVCYVLDSTIISSNEAVTFSNSFCEGNFMFHSVSIRGGLSLNSSKFNSQVDIYNVSASRFDEYALMITNVTSEARFTIGNECCFEGGIYVAGSEFNESLMMAGLEVFCRHSEVSINIFDTSVEKTLQVAMLKSCPIGDVSIINSSAYKFTFDDTSQPRHGSVKLIQFDYSTLGYNETPQKRVDWLKRNQPDQIYANAWNTCAKAVAKGGDVFGAKFIMIMMNREINQRVVKNSSLWWLKFWRPAFWYKTLRTVWGQTTLYGYYPVAAVVWLVAFLFASSCFYFWEPTREKIVPAKERFYLSTSYAEYLEGGGLPINYPKFNPILYAADILIPIVDFQQTAHWRVGNTKGINWHRFLEWFLMLIGWFLTSAFVIGLTSNQKEAFKD